ncbi:MAG: amidohydrolase [candidate division Zixibacteria bacterium]|nr:amidohydrolase [candidate division Zixibacteria bacterium]
MKKGNLFFNGIIYTQAGDCLVADSMAVKNGRIVAVGKKLEMDADFASFAHINLKNHAVLPGFVDSHTHFYFMAISMGNVKLDGLNSIEETLGKIRVHATRLNKNDWVVGEGFSPDRWKKYILPDRFMLDKVTGGRPAAIFSKDTHMMWANSKALAMAGINRGTPEPKGATIVRLYDGEPSGILKEIPAYFPVFRLISRPEKAKALKLYRMALDASYRKGVTGVHSFDGPEAFPFFVELAEKGRLGLRINYYAPNKMLPALEKGGIQSVFGDDCLRLSGIKIFADGALGSQTAFCFNKYIGSENNYGIEVTSQKDMTAMIETAAALGLPCAVHALGDKAIAHVLDWFEQAPKLLSSLRHRIEHLQLIRRSDIGRLKKLQLVASMQPSHCPSDIKMINKYWGNRGKNCFIFRTLLDRGIPLAFGSDAPIEPLDPIAGIDAAVNRFSPGTKESFHPEERLSVAEAVYNFTAGPAYAVGEEHERGYILPGYKADFIILSEDIYKVARTRIKDITVGATYFNGRLVFQNKNLSLFL